LGVEDSCWTPFRPLVGGRGEGSCAHFRAFFPVTGPLVGTPPHIACGKEPGGSLANTGRGFAGVVVHFYLSPLARRGELLG
jgi:hypothetical protein